MTEFQAQKREKNDIVHVTDGTMVTKHWTDTTQVPQAVCGSYKFSENVNRFEVSRDEVLGEDYLVVDGDIVGKFCGNCSLTLASR